MGTIDNLRALFRRGFINPSSSDFSIEKLADGRHRVEVSPQGFNSLAAQALQGGTGGKPGGGGTPGGGGICPGPHAPSNWALTGTATANATLAPCSSTASFSGSGSLTWALDINSQCKNDEAVHAAPTFNCTGPTCSCTLTLGQADSIISFTVAWNGNFPNSWEFDVIGSNHGVNDLTFCGCPGGSATGGQVATGPINLGANPIGSHAFNFNDGVNFFSVNITLS